MARRQIFYDIDADDIEFVRPDPPSPGKKKTGIGIGTRIGIEYKHSPLILAPRGCKFYSFGLQEDVFNEIRLGTYSMCLCVNFDPEEESKEKDFCVHVNSIYEKCKDYVLANKREFNVKVKDAEELNEIFKCPLKASSTSKYSGLKIYAKIIMTKKTQKIWSTFFDTEGHEVDPLAYKNIHSLVYPALLFDSIYISTSGISLQCKISQAVVEKASSSDGPLLDMSLLSLS